jgi:hypothetical protein
MRSSVTSRSFARFTALIGLAVGLAACDMTPSANVPSGTGGNAAGTGGSASGSGGSASGSGGSASGSGGSASGSGGASGGAVGSGGTAGEGTGGSPADAGSGGSADAGRPDATAGGWAGIPGIEDLSTVKATVGCGMDPGQALGSWVRKTLTMMPKPVRGTGVREYFINLPANYDNKKPYRLIIVSPGCGGKGNTMWDFTAAAGTEGVIQVGVSPDPGTSPSGACFDDMRTDSVEYAFIEALHALISKSLCFDQHHVYITGHSSGGWLSNQMGCVYGSKLIRAVAPSSGGLATGAGKAPPCSDLPTPGIWSHNEDDTGNRIAGSITAINRALKVNKCGPGDFTTAPRAPYLNYPMCQKFSGCPAEFPIVICHPATGGHLGNLAPQPARALEFWKSLP